MSNDLEKWAMRGMRSEVDRLAAEVRKLEIDQARDRLMPVIRERIGDPKRAREAFDAFIADEEYGRVEPSAADEKRLHVWLTLASSSEPYRRPVDAPKTAPEPAQAVEAPKVESHSCFADGTPTRVSAVMGALLNPGDSDAFARFLMGGGGK